MEKQPQGKFKALRDLVLRELDHLMKPSSISIETPHATVDLYESFGISLEFGVSWSTKNL